MIFHNDIIIRRKYKDYKYYVMRLRDPQRIFSYTLYTAYVSVPKGNPLFEQYKDYYNLPLHARSEITFTGYAADLDLGGTDEWLFGTDAVDGMSMISENGGVYMINWCKDLIDQIIEYSKSREM